MPETPKFAVFLDFPHTTPNLVSSIYPTKTSASVLLARLRISNNDSSYSPVLEEQILTPPHQASFIYSTKTSASVLLARLRISNNNSSYSTALEQQILTLPPSSQLTNIPRASKMDSYQAAGYSAPTANSADLRSSNAYPVPNMSQTTLQGPPDNYRTMPVDDEDPTPGYPYGINQETGEPFEYPPPPSPPEFEARPASFPAPPLAAAPPAPSRRSTRTRQPRTRQASTPPRQTSAPARLATNDRVFKTTNQHRNVSKQAHAEYRGKEIEAARALHGMVPGAFQSAEAIKAGGTKEKMRAMDDAMSYIAALEEENQELRRQLGG